MKKVIAFLVSAAALSAFAQTTIDIGRGNTPRAAGPYSPSNQAAVPKYQQKSFWFPGGVCSIVRTGMMPDLMTVATTMPEHLKASTVDMCIGELSKVSFEGKFQEIESVHVDTLKDARTSNMTCTIVGQAQTPLIYQIRFSAFSLTGKDREIKDCLAKAANAPEKAAPLPIPGRPMSL